MSSPDPGPPREAKFWLPPPPQAAALPVIRASLPSFPSPPLRISRVGQLDGALLDQELEGILGGPLWKALEGIRSPGRRSWEPEMQAVLRLAILKMSLWERGATYGSTLQNLKYRNELQHRDGFQSTAIDSSLTGVQKGAYMALEVVPTYLYARLRDRMLSSSWSDEYLPASWLSLIDLRRLSQRRRRNTGEEEGQWRGEWKRVAFELLGVCERVGAIAGLANFLIFLYDGKYRTLVDRILGMRLVYAERSVNRNVSFEFLNRQLVWEAFTEFLLFLMPLINLHRLRLRLARLLSSSSSSSSISTILSALPAPLVRALGLPTRLPPLPATSSSPTAPDPTTRPEGPFHFLPPTTCPICYSNSTALPTDQLPGSTDSLAAVGGGARSTRVAPEDTSVKVPYVTDCGWGCRYCYYCVVGKLAGAEEDGESSWGCLRCGGEVRGVTREEVEEREEVVGEVEGGEGEEGSEALDGDEVAGGEDSAESRGEDEDDWREGLSDVGSIGSQHDRWR